MPDDMELVEQNRRLRCMRIRRQSKRLPHVHDRQTNAGTLSLAEPDVEPAHARLRAVLAAKPDRRPAQEVTDHDPVGVTFADRYLVDADRLRTRRAGALGLPCKTPKSFNNYVRVNHIDRSNRLKPAALSIEVASVTTSVGLN